MQYIAFSWENASTMVAVTGKSTVNCLATTRAKMYPEHEMSVLVVSILLPIVIILTSCFITKVLVDQ
eukprot:16372415-Heterocapsa_arctica.AAC.1